MARDQEKGLIWKVIKLMSLHHTLTSKHNDPHLITYSILINGFCKKGKLLIAVEILDKMKLQGIKPDAGLYGKIIDGFCEIFKFQESANFLKETKLMWNSPKRLAWSLHVRTNNIAVESLCSNSDWN